MRTYRGMTRAECVREAWTCRRWLVARINRLDAERQQWVELLNELDANFQGECLIDDDDALQRRTSNETPCPHERGPTFLTVKISSYAPPKTRG